MAAGSILERLHRVQDPRRRQGRRYPLPGLLGAMILAVMQGENSLRGIAQWMRLHWEEIAEPLNLWATKGAPSYGTLWNLLASLDPKELNQVLQGAEEGGGYTLDGKHLRGSKRQSQAALQVVTLAGARYGQILAQQEVEAGNELAAALRLLQEVPMAGKLVSMDAGLLQRETVATVAQKGGPTSGSSRATMGLSMRL
ncbi:MAG: hypothetical protein KatS3mg050_0987 [Litorilinea sp.]|nr:MAG: hypothetical protein KatS3mg050_0987 [Litorilinea sp.]